MKSAVENSQSNYQQSQPEQPQVDLTTFPKLRVPEEDSLPFLREELAPRAPKGPQANSRRRSFLPSRNGNVNLPRGLLPVGGKAIQSPRGFALQNKKPEDTETESQTEISRGNEEISRPESGFKFQNSGGVEFRAKLSTAIGVDQPKLTPFFQEVQSSSELDLPEYGENPQPPVHPDSDYYPSLPPKREKANFGHARSPYQENKPSRIDPSSQDVSSSQITQDYRPDNDQALRHEANANYNFRPILKATDFSHINEEQTAPQQEIHRNRNVDSPFRGRHVPSLVGQPPQISHFNSKETIFSPSQEESQPLQISPPSFYSENPKFKTTIKVPNQFQFKPTGQAVNYNAGVHLPTIQANVRQNAANGQRQIDSPQENNLKHLNLKFPPQNENLDDSDEYDVSLNDALQPISTLHPRNVATGIYLSNSPRSQQQGAGFKRRIHQERPSRGGHHEYVEDGVRNGGSTSSRRQESSQRGVHESRNVPNQQKRFVAQREAASNIQPTFVPSPSLQPRQTCYRPWQICSDSYTIN